MDVIIDNRKQKFVFTVGVLFGALHEEIVRIAWRFGFLFVLLHKSLQQNEQKCSMNRSQVIDSIRQVASTALPKGSSLLLYGSRARGDAHKGSDWDLLILLDKPELTDSDYDNVSFPFTMLGWNIGELISPQMYTKKEWEAISFLPFHKNVEHDKIVLA